MRQGNCLVVILAIVLLLWLMCWGGCELIKKKTSDGLAEPVPGKVVK
jgi:hypothetical protein